MFEANLASNLRRLRSHHGLTQDDVAKGAGISRVAYRDLEAGKVKAPKTPTVVGLAKVFGVGVDELLRAQTSLKEVRFRSTKKMNNREQILNDVGRWLQDFNEIEDILQQQMPFKLAKIRDKASKIKSNGADRAKIVAQWVRDHFSLSPEEPIYDICSLLDSAGIKVYPFVAQTDAFFGLSIGARDGGPAIAINTWDKISVERWIFSSAHELGHLLLHLDAYDIENSDENPDEEHEADQFAAEFLMPDAAFRRELNDSMGLGLVDRVMKIKRIFRVSYKTVLMRIKQYETDTGRRSRGSWDNVFVRFQTEYKQRNGRGVLKAEEPEGLSPVTFRTAEPDRLLSSDFEEDRLKRLVRIAIEKKLISIGRGAEILQRSLEEMRELANSWI